MAPEPDPAESEEDAAPEVVGEEVVVVEAHPVEPVRPAGLPAVPAVQAAAVATAGFAAGVVTVAAVRRHQRKKVARRRRKSLTSALPVVASRSFLVDVHLLGTRE